MKIKVFQTNPNGKIEFTPAELENLLNDTFAEGVKEGEIKKADVGLTWTNPYVAPYINDTITTCTSEEKVSKDENVGACNSARAPYPTVNLKINSEDAKKMSESIDKIFNRICTNDAFSKLAKELNF